MHYPDQALEKLEEVSYLTKHHGGPKGIKTDEFLVVEEHKNYQAVANDLNKYGLDMGPYFKVHSIWN